MKVIRLNEDTQSIKGTIKVTRLNENREEDLYQEFKNALLDAGSDEIDAKATAQVFANDVINRKYTEAEIKELINGLKDDKLNKEKVAAAEEERNKTLQLETKVREKIKEVKSKYSKNSKKIIDELKNINDQEEKIRFLDIFLSKNDDEVTEIEKLNDQKLSELISDLKKSLIYNTDRENVSLKDQVGKGKKEPDYSNGKTVGDYQAEFLRARSVVNQASVVKNAIDSVTPNTKAGTGIYKLYGSGASANLFLVKFIDALNWEELEKDNSFVKFLDTVDVSTFKSPTQNTYLAMYKKNNPKGLLLSGKELFEKSYNAYLNGKMDNIDFNNKKEMAGLFNQIIGDNSKEPVPRKIEDIVKALGNIKTKEEYSKLFSGLPEDQLKLVVQGLKDVTNT